MDALRLLSRGTKRKRQAQPSAVLPSGQDAKPQPFQVQYQHDSHRAEITTNLLGVGRTEGAVEQGQRSVLDVDDGLVDRSPLAARKHVLKQHKIKTSLLPQKYGAKRQRPRQSSSKHDKQQLYPKPVATFQDLATASDMPRWLLQNLNRLGFTETTDVQMASLALQMLADDVLLEDGATCDATLESCDLLAVAPTGSGKTLSFLVPTIARINKHAHHEERSNTTFALVLAPTKELADQTVNEGRRLLQGSSFKISLYSKDMSLAGLDDSTVGARRKMTLANIVVATPGLLSNAMEQLEPQSGICSSTRYLILDEADVLLDPLFREQTVGIWKKLSHFDLTVSLWSATMGSNIEDLTQSIMQQRREVLTELTGATFESRLLVRIVVGLKDSAVPNVEHKLIYAATEQGKLMGLRQLLHPTSISGDSAPALRPPFIIFTQTIERAIALHSELLYDIPAEAGGITRIAVLHSELSDAAREKIMTRFRQGEVWILITTDLLSRGVDFRGVNGVVNYDIPSSSAAYVHRVGRTGRAGREGGVAVTLYSKEDIPYLKHIANVVAAAQRAKGTNDSNGVQKWLLDALPTLSKNDKQRLKKRGVEIRTARGMEKDAKAARRARISTKAGYDRKEENRKKQSIESSKRRAAVPSTGVSADDFGGFD